MTERDWPEDKSHENGNYHCKCYWCGCMFIWYKRRFACKVCAETDHSVPSPDSIEPK